MPREVNFFAAFATLTALAASPRSRECPAAASAAPACFVLKR